MTFVSRVFPDGVEYVTECVYEAGGVGTVKYSICIPTYNRNEKLRVAIESAARQTYRGDYEIVVVDNDPKNVVDFSQLEFSPNCRFRYFRNAENIGMIRNWNALLMNAEAPLVSVLCDDDRLHPTFLERADMAISLTPEIQFLQFPAMNFSMAANVGGDFGVAECSDYVEAIGDLEVLFDGVNCNIACLIDRELAVSLGGFSLQEYPSFDHLLAKRMVFNHPGSFRVRSNREAGYYCVDENESSRINTQVMFVRVDYGAYMQLLATHGILVRSLGKATLDAKTAARICELDISEKKKIDLRNEIGISMRFMWLKMGISHFVDLYFKMKRRIGRCLQALSRGDL